MLNRIFNWPFIALLTALFLVGHPSSAGTLPKPESPAGFSWYIPVAHETDADGNTSLEQGLSSGRIITHFKATDNSDFYSIEGSEVHYPSLDAAAQAAKKPPVQVLALATPYKGAEIAEFDGGQGKNVFQVTGVPKTYPTIGMAQDVIDLQNKKGTPAPHAYGGDGKHYDSTYIMSLYKNPDQKPEDVVTMQAKAHGMTSTTSGEQGAGTQPTYTVGSTGGSYSTGGPCGTHSHWVLRTHSADATNVAHVGMWCPETGESVVTFDRGDNALHQARFDANGNQTSPTGTTASYAKRSSKKRGAALIAVREPSVTKPSRSGTRRAPAAPATGSVAPMPSWSDFVSPPAPAGSPVAALSATTPKNNSSQVGTTIDRRVVPAPMISPLSVAQAPAPKVVASRPAKRAPLVPFSPTPQQQTAFLNTHPNTSYGIGLLNGKTYYYVQIVSPGHYAYYGADGGQPK